MTKHDRKLLAAIRLIQKDIQNNCNGKKPCPEPMAHCVACDAWVLLGMLNWYSELIRD